MSDLNDKVMITGEQSWLCPECFTNNTVNDEEYTSQCTFCSYFVSLVEDAPSSSSVDPCAKKKMIFGRKFWGKLKKNISKRRFTAASSSESSSSSGTVKETPSGCVNSVGEQPALSGSNGPVDEDEERKTAGNWHGTTSLSSNAVANKESFFCDHSVCSVTDQPAVLVNEEEELETIGYWHCRNCLTCNTMYDEEDSFTCTFCDHSVGLVTDQPAVSVDEEEELETIGYWHCPKCLTCNTVYGEGDPFSCILCGCPGSSLSSSSSCGSSGSSSPSQNEDSEDKIYSDLIGASDVKSMPGKPSNSDRELRSSSSFSNQHGSTSGNTGTTNVIHNRHWESDYEDEEEARSSKQPAETSEVGFSDVDSPSHQHVSSSRNSGLIADLTDEEPHCFKIVLNNHKQHWESDYEDEEEARSSKQPAETSEVGFSDVDSPSHQHVSSSRNSGLIADLTDEEPHCFKIVLNNHKQHWESDYEDEEEARSSKQPAETSEVGFSDVDSPSHQHVSSSRNSGLIADLTDEEPHCFKIGLNNHKQHWESDYEDEEEARSSKQPAETSKVGSSDVDSPSHQCASTSRNSGLIADLTDEEPHCFKTVLNNHKRHRDSDDEDEVGASSSSSGKQAAKKQRLTLQIWPLPHISKPVLVETVG
ncbi:uncharacterized protein LOC108272422 isoform X3 [Ictalurus punctatus]|uniref:Uncharacterized protein LOC108272422 isoform X3 n=1 Tax=Ictalurus punctatus TaxID=7998 RepID=A0A9F7RNX2_ICTPU|nr:uncharacterized protein LOC108272422 isoform X3 [Ictalurus punctatus]